MIIQLITGDVRLSSIHIEVLKCVYNYSVVLGLHKPILDELMAKGLIHRNGHFYECTTKGDAAMKIINGLKGISNETVYKTTL